MTRARRRAAPAPALLVERVLALADDAGRGSAPDALDAFRRFLLIYGATRSWIWVSLAPDGIPTLIVAASVLSLASALTFVPRVAPLAPRLALLGLALQLGWHFPQHANHFYLELLCVLILALVGRNDPAGEALALRGLRWLTAIVLFHTGLQKVLYGHYFQGDFLALMAGNQERFANLFRLVLPADELTRLASYEVHRTGAGPYRVSHLPFVVASNLVYLAELGLPFLMMWARTRVLGAVLAIALMVAIQLGAIEVGFAFLFLNLLFLFLPGSWNRRLLPVFAFVLVYAVGAAFGWLPGDPKSWNLL